MRHGVDPARQAGYDDEARLAEPGRELARQRLPAGRGIARADQCDAVLGEQGLPPLGIEHRRGRLVMRQQRGKIRLDREDRSRARFGGGLELGLGAVLRTDLEALATAAHEVRERVERLTRAAEVIDQFAECDRADVLGPDQAQARQPLRVVEFGLGQGRGNHGPPTRVLVLSAWHRSSAPRPTSAARCLRDACRRPAAT